MEVQGVADLVVAITRLVDVDDRPGRVVMTGSTRGDFSSY